MNHSHAASAGRQLPISLSANSLHSDNISPSTHYESPVTDRLPSSPPLQNTPYVKDVSMGRGRVTDFASSIAQPLQMPTRSQQSQPSQGEIGHSRPVNMLERKVSNSYGHHRQTSVIHGFQHSRNPSTNNSSANSPLTPETLGIPSNGGLDSALRSQDMSPSVGGSLVAGSIQAQKLSGSTITEHSSTSDAANVAAHQRRPTMSSRPKHSHREQPSHSRQRSGEPRTPGEFALHHLLNSFVAQADQKINQCVASTGEMAIPIEQICGSGIDATFDQLIKALGYISRSKPRYLVDSLMYWRKGKSEASSHAKNQLNHSRPAPTTSNAPPSLLRRNTEPVQPNNPSTDQEAKIPLSASPADELVLAERRALVSVYLVCRVLIEIFEQSSLAAITPELAEKLEDIVFGQLKVMEPGQIANSNLRMANWRIYGELLGYMSKSDFSKVANRFLQELEVCQREISRSPGNVVTKELENRTELLVLGMRGLHIRSHPSSAWLESAEVFRHLGRLFANSHGQVIKQAYCHILGRLILPIVSDPRSDLSLVRWREFLDIVNPRISQMLTKPRHWNTAYPLSSLLLCASPREVFLSQWYSTISNLGTKLKDRSTKGFALQAICRLTWTYLYRHPEHSSGTTRRIEEVMKIALPQGRKTHLSTDPFIAEPLIELIRIIGFRHQELCFRTIIFPLINSELISNTKDLKIEQMEPEKMVIGIRAFLAVMSDLEKGEQGRPGFPQTFPSASVVDPLSAPPPNARPQLVAETKSSPPARKDSFARPVAVVKLPDVARKYYLRFCEVLGKITILCDNAFGGQAALNEKFAIVPKTPLADTFSFGKKDEATTMDQRQAYYDLLHVATQALPRCLSDHVPFASLINLLCTGSVHIQSTIAASSSQSLKAIARQGHAQQVAIGYPRFIFSYDLKYSTMSDEGVLGPGHIETTLTLYIDLLKIWTTEIRQKIKAAAGEGSENGGAALRGIRLEMSNLLTQVDEIESYGLFFLCSQSRRVRSFAIEVLRMVTDFDKALGIEQPNRVIRILQEDSRTILDLNEDHLSVAERSRLQQGKRRSAAQNTLLEICSSEGPYDSTLWFKIFPNLIRVIYQMCPNVIALGRLKVCDRLVQMQSSIEFLADQTRIPQHLAQESRMMTARNAATPPEVLIEQWKLYLTTICVTLNHPGAQSQSQLANAVHARKTSRQAASTSHEKMGSARALFSAVIPLLSAGPEPVRNAIVSALGAINKKLYRTLLESLQYAVTTCNDEAKARIGTHHRSPSSPMRSPKTDRLRTEVTHVYKLTSAFLRDPEVGGDDWILNNLAVYSKDLRMFLSDAEVQNDWKFQRLRFHYCGLMEQLFEGINRSKTPARWLPFESRKAAFTLMEDWCGFSSNPNQTSQREDAMRQFAIEQQQESAERIYVSASMEKEKTNLRVAALSAMASLCAGPISIKTESRTVLQFNLPRILSWIGSIFSTPSDRSHLIGRRALKLLIVHNKEHSYIMEHAIERCYESEALKTLESYFAVVAEVLVEHQDYPLAFARILGAVIFTLGSESREIRRKSAHLLRTLEDRQQKTSKLIDFDISITDKTTGVYKLAQFEYSRRLSKAHSELAFVIFSEFALHFRNVSTDHQRDMVAAILPWIQTMELQLDPNGGPTAHSYMLLSNLFEITVKSSGVLHNEVQALWQALATGPHGGNVQLTLDFIIHLSLDRREQNFVDHAKQVVVYLSATPAGSKVIEFLLQQLVPKNMVNEKKVDDPSPPDMSILPYVADLSTILPTGNKQAGLSLGQIALIFLVDLTVAPVNLPTDDAIQLVHAVLILWDHYIPSVQEHAREMLVHLIHELVTSKLEDKILAASGAKIERLVEAIRRNEPEVIWLYEENNGKEEDVGGSRVPPSMTNLSKGVVEVFSIVYQNFNDMWAKEALNWASTCPVRHLACRSFQVFRCISIMRDHRMLADMLARLSNTIADEETDYQTFSMEILTTLKIIIGDLDSLDILRYPQLFWTTCACLNTIHEREFSESLGMLEKLLVRLDLSDPIVVQALIESKPATWEGTFEGIQPLVYKGLKSTDSLERTISVLDLLVCLPDNELTGDRSRILYSTLANLPRFLQQFDLETKEQEALRSAIKLAEVAEGQGLTAMARCLMRFANGNHRSSAEFLNPIVDTIRSYFSPEHDGKILIFLMGLLTNTSSWFRMKSMDILCVLIPEIDMRSPDIARHGPDLISPLLRLLQTDMCPQALSVMDHIMEVSGNPMERHHIRMSLASGSSKAIRKEYESTESLYGIPLNSGWSIPIPALYSGLTRHNVHAVFYSCGSPDAKEVAYTPDVEFRDEGYQASYFPTRRTNTMKSVDTAPDANMNELLHKLDSYDEFFDDVQSAADPGQTTPYESNDFHDAGTNIYDQQTAPILKMSLARTASTSSFHNGLAESRPSTSHNTGSMTPTALNPMTTINLATLDLPTLPAPASSVPSGPARPTLHGRSITSPANSFPISHPTSAPAIPNMGTAGSFLSEEDEEYDEATFSDSESTPFPKLALVSSASATSGPGPSLGGGNSSTSLASRSGENNGAFTFESVRRGMRRLTASKSEKEKDRIREMARMRAMSGSAANGGSDDSPRVPKVPLEYLSKNQSRGATPTATSPNPER